MHGPIAEDVYVDFARSLFTEREKTIEEDPIRWAFKLFDGNTFYMQRTMNGAFADTPSGTTCGHDTVARAVRSMLAANEVIYREILSTSSYRGPASYPRERTAIRSAIRSCAFS